MREIPTELDLFIGFLSASVRGFGGVFVMGRRMLVEERKWLTPDEFVELLGVCQFLPGANIVNLSVAISMLGPGVAWATANSSENSRALIQWRRSTT